MAKIAYVRAALCGSSMQLKAVAIVFVLSTVALFAVCPRAEEAASAPTGLEPCPGETSAAVQGNDVFKWQPDVKLLDDGRILVPFENVTGASLKAVTIAVRDGRGGVFVNNVYFTLAAGEKLYAFITPPIKIPRDKQTLLTLDIAYEQDSQSKTTAMELVLDSSNINGTMQEQGDAFLVSDIQEITGLPITEGNRLFSVAGKVRVDAVGEIRANTDTDGREFAEQDRTFSLSLLSKQAVTITAIAVIGFDNDFSTQPVALTPGQPVEFILRRVPPVVMSAGNFESLAIDVEGVIGGKPFVESFTLNLNSTNTIGGGHLQGSIVPESWDV